MPRSTTLMFTVVIVLLVALVALAGVAVGIMLDPPGDVVLPTPEPPIISVPLD